MRQRVRIGVRHRARGARAAPAVSPPRHDVEACLDADARSRCFRSPAAATAAPFERSDRPCDARDRRHDAGTSRSVSDTDADALAHPCSRTNLCAIRIGLSDTSSTSRRGSETASAMPAPRAFAPRRRDAEEVPGTTPAPAPGKLRPGARQASADSARPPIRLAAPRLGRQPCRPASSATSFGPTAASLRLTATSMWPTAPSM